MMALRKARSTILFMLGLVTVCIVLGLVITWVIQLDQRADSTETEAFRRQAQLDSVAEDVRVLRSQLIDVGEVPAAPDPSARVSDVDDLPEEDIEPGPPGRPPTAAEIRSAIQVVIASDPAMPEAEIQQATTRYLQENPPDSGPQGEAGRAPTPAELEVAVATFCTGGACRGDEGEPGSGPTDEQIGAAVAIYCDSRGQCRGSQGDPGPGPSNEEIVEALSAYCAARNECEGDPGDDSTVPGPPGPTCPEGSVASEVEVWVTVDNRPDWVTAIACLVRENQPEQEEG